jgi:CBS domain-containing protein
VVWGDEEDDSVGLWGVVSDLDLVVAVARGDVPAGDAVGAAHAPVVSVREDLRLREAAELMAPCRTAHLVVQDDRLRPVGVLSSPDLARALAVD